MVWSLLFTFLTTLIVYFTKKICETYWCSGSIACWEKRTDWILRIFTFNDKKPLYLPIISTLQFFRGSKWSRSNPISHKAIWHIPNISNSEFKIKNAKFFQTLFCFSFIFLGNTSRKLWDRSLSPPIINAGCKYLRQLFGTRFRVATLPLCCNMGRGRDLFLFLQSGWFQNFQKLVLVDHLAPPQLNAHGKAL